VGEQGTEERKTYFLEVKTRTSKLFVFLIITYTFSSTKLEIRAEQILPGRE
jgi:hypothetical protein